MNESAETLSPTDEVKSFCIDFNKLENPKMISDDGAEKIIFEASYNGIKVAYKQYRETNYASDEIINTSEESIAEFNSYKTLEKSPIGGYIPKAIALITKDGSVSGLLVEHRKGKDLSYIYPYKLLTKKELERLKKAVMNTYEQGFNIEPDMFSEANIMLDPNIKPGVKGRIWFAECKLLSREVVDYVRLVNKCFENLQADHAAP